SRCGIPQERNPAARSRLRRAHLASSPSGKSLARLSAARSPPTAGQTPEGGGFAAATVFGKGWLRLAGGAGQEVGLHEVVECAVEHRLRVPRLVIRAVVLDHLVRVEDVRADLAAE